MRCVPWLRAEGGDHLRGLASTDGRGVVTPRGLGDYNLWVWGGDDLGAGAATTCGPGALVPVLNVLKERFDRMMSESDEDGFLKQVRRI